MARVTGVGSVFFRSKDPQALQEWYVDHLGLSSENAGFVIMNWGDAGGTTISAPFAAGTDSSDQPINGWSTTESMTSTSLLGKLRDKGVRVDEGREREIRMVLGLRGQQDRAVRATTG